MKKPGVAAVVVGVLAGDRALVVAPRPAKGAEVPGFCPKSDADSPGFVDAWFVKSPCPAEVCGGGPAGVVDMLPNNGAAPDCAGVAFPNGVVFANAPNNPDCVWPDDAGSASLGVWLAPPNMPAVGVCPPLCPPLCP